jgi:subtilisin family serine protease
MPKKSSSKSGGGDMPDFPLQLRHPSGQMMSLERDRVVVSLSSSPTRAAASNVLSELGLVLETGDETRGAGLAQGSAAPQVRVNHTASRFWTRTRDGTAFTAEKLTAARASASGDSLEWVAPVYSFQAEGRTEYLALLPQVLVIKPRPGASSEDVSRHLKSFGLEEDTERSKYLGDQRYFVLDEPLEHTSIELLPKIAAEHSDLLEEVRFESMPMFVPTALAPNDPMYGDQWGVQRIGAGGAGEAAWDITRGDPDIVICVLDAGCDLAHPDLVPFADDGINLGTMLPDGGPTGNHGTACAGIAAANIDNAAGIAGVAGDCRILPVAFDSWTDVEVAAGIRYATLNGARVISMSFGWNPWDPGIIDPAIQEAFEANVVMCVATHNHNASITYPATNPLVMACGASDQVDNRKSPNSPDGENWGSNFGPEISVVAPGVRIPTTDRLGNDGYNVGDYHPLFNGTSSATPHVAGLAALLLSRDPSLTNVAVHNVIERTADKVGSVPYAETPGYPNGTWNEEMGYGRINALSAVQAVTPRSAQLVCGRPSNVVTDVWRTVKFCSGFDVPPIVLTSIETFDGPDTAGTRLRNVTTEGFEVRIEEEQSRDQETWHTTEVVGFAALSPGIVEDAIGNAVGEAGVVSVSQSDGSQWHNLSLHHTYCNPVVLMQIMTFNGTQPCHIRLRNVLGNSFQFQIEEWDYLDQSHVNEQVGYLVIEGRRHQLPFGKVIEAGKIDLNHEWATVELGLAFSANPVTLSQCQTISGSQAVVTRERNVSISSFDVRLQEEEANDGVHLTEVVGYLAIEQR